MARATDGLFELFEQITLEPWAVHARAARRLSGKAADRTSLLTIQKVALETILEDLGEHGDANRDEYGGHPDAHYRALLGEVKRALRAIPKAERDRSGCSGYLERLENRDTGDAIAAIERQLAAQLGGAKGKPGAFSFEEAPAPAPAKADRASAKRAPKRPARKRS